MPRAEVGSTKHIANQMKAKGLQRLRWYCQACQRQMRDENGFKCHVASESHVRQMQLIGEDPRKAINDFSNQFLRDFIQLLRTGHGEKKVNVNHFYQEYISNKEHIHMNATKWNSLTEFAKYLGREGICRVDEDEKNESKTGASGLTISWIDNSPEALRRQEAIRKKERQDRGDELREQRMIEQQIRKAKSQGLGDATDDKEDGEDDGENVGEGIKREQGEKIVLDFKVKKKAPETTNSPTPLLSFKKETSSEKENAPTKGNVFKIAQKKVMKENPFNSSKRQQSNPPPKDPNPWKKWDASIKDGSKRKEITTSDSTRLEQSEQKRRRL
ncbi:hypothetical protein Z517_10734 [Fonsecaea pedrosoi CBS 271.37]|uniref:C2H2-type domain-containing protein n=1 Tax=Fonsecaea pedrosoi CBS 271.37 TaxID=1442368 RepID=A0A0D2GUF2_9EURO|nr:uncharacterized protein Z517_10734 [Fonsecaea pedrosoi CBS 271.37]KIW75989.1 hypothetical protein Z517_10734 [Fonsecaea pedrosoi CBS 271.37]